MNKKDLILKYQEKIFPILDIGLNGLNYFFHIFCSWYIIQKDYGKLNALLSILAILIVAGISFQIYTAKEIAQKGVTAKQIYKVAFIYVGVLTIVFLGLSKQLINFTKSSYLSLFLLFIVFFLNLFLSILRGIFQGEKQFLNLNISFYIEGFCKILFIVILLPFYKNLNIVLMSLIVGMVGGIIHGIIKLKIKTLIIKEQKEIKPIVKNLGIIYISNFFIYYFTSIDMMIFNYNINEISGIYAVILRYSQIILFISFSLITVFIPNLSIEIKNKKILNKKKFNKKIKKYFFILLVIQFILLMFYKTIFPTSIKYLFGNDYLEAGEYLFLGSIMYSMLVNCFYLVNINIVLEKKRYIYWLGIIAFGYTYFLFKYGVNISVFLKGGIVFYTILFLLLIFTFVFEEMKLNGRE